MATLQRKSSKSFLDLPAEIRNAIYTLHLDSVFRKVAPIIFWKHITPSYNALQQSCQQIRNEVKPMLGTYLGKLDLVVTIDIHTVKIFNRFLSTVAEPTLAKLKSIILQFPNGYEEDLDQERSMVIKIHFDTAQSSFSIVDCFALTWGHFENLVIVELGEPAIVSLCPRYGVALKNAKVQKSYLKKWLKDLGYGDGIPVWAACEPHQTAVPLFVRPVIEAWQGDRFTMTGLRKLVDMLHLALKDTASELEEDHKLEEDRREEFRDGAVDSSSNDQANGALGGDMDEKTYKGTDEASNRDTNHLKIPSMEGDDQDGVHAHDTCTSLIVRLPIKRAGFQMFPWGVKVKYEHVNNTRCIKYTGN